MHYFSRNQITGRGMTYEDVVTAALVSGKFLRVCDWLQRTASISLASVKEQRSGEAIFPAWGQRATCRAWCDKDTWCWKRACACCMVCWHTEWQLHRAQTLRLYWMWAAVPCMCVKAGVASRFLLWFRPVMLTVVSLCFRTILTWPLIAAVLIIYSTCLLWCFNQASGSCWCSRVMFRVWVYHSGGDFSSLIWGALLFMLTRSQWLIWFHLCFLRPAATSPWGSMCCHYVGEGESPLNGSSYLYHCSGLHKEVLIKYVPSLLPRRIIGGGHTELSNTGCS